VPEKAETLFLYPVIFASKEIILIKYLPLKFGNSLEDKFLISGGPYREIPKGFAGVKMAREIDAPCYIDVPTQDFSVPDMGKFTDGVQQALLVAISGVPVYVGCMGGIGRTGLFLAGMAKVSLYMQMRWWERLLGMQPEASDVVAYVRSNYISHALETDEQEAYVDLFDPRPAAKAVKTALKFRKYKLKKGVDIGALRL